MKTAAALVALLTRRGLSCAVAESCTGGGVGAAITAVPGASAVFRGGVIAYANEAKRDLLGVPAAILDGPGPVSPECAAAMADGARRLFRADFAVSVTGLAGPGGDGVRPAGCVWFGVASAAGTATGFGLFPGDRAAVRNAATRHALCLLLAAARG